MALLQVSRSRTRQCEISGHCTDVTHVILLIILCSEGTQSHMQAPLISFAEQPIVEQYLKICFRQGIRERVLNPCEFFLHSVIVIPIKGKGKLQLVKHRKSLNRLFVLVSYLGCW